MSHKTHSPGQSLRTWRIRLFRVPGGRRLFSRLLTRMVPYTGTIKPLVLELEPGFARVAMRDRRAVRNHLRSIHAIALANLAEVTSGLAMIVALPETVRGIPISLEITYLKKARGTLTAECTCTVPPVYTPLELELTPVIRDRDNAIVAHATIRWRLAPVAVASAE